MVILFSISLVLVLYSVFFNKLLTLGVLFSATVRTVVVVAKLVILGISYLTLFILALRAVV